MIILDALCDGCSSVGVLQRKALWLVSWQSAAAAAWRSRQGLPRYALEERLCLALLEGCVACNVLNVRTQAHVMLCFWRQCDMMRHEVYV
jgi:hypothetical protein